MKFILRYDDYSSLSDTDVEMRLVDVCQELKLRCTFAVTPFFADVLAVSGDCKLSLVPLSREKAALLKPAIQSGVVEVALHGYSHLCTSRLRSLAEFSEAMPVAQQRSLLRAGRQHLEDLFGVSVTTFVPPWNLCVRATIEALQEEGFTCVSAAPPLAFSSTGISEMFWQSSLAYAPAGAGTGDVMRLSRLMQRFDAQQSVAGIVLHDYDFYGEGKVPASELKKALGPLARHGSSLVSEALPALAGGRDRYFANLDVGKKVWASAVRRRVGRGLADVYWSESAASKVNSLLGFVP